MAYKETIVQQGSLYKRGYVEESPPPTFSKKKAEQREEITSRVFDVHDSIADNAKWCSILTTLLSRIYDVLPEAQKDDLDPTDRGLIEATFAKFAVTNTRADVQIAKEGFGVIDRMLTRQKDVGTIIDKSGI